MKKARYNYNVRENISVQRDITQNTYGFQFDRDRDGYLGICEMKQLIRRHQCDDIPKGVARQILECADDDGDGRLDFEEFFAMSQEHNWLFKGFVVKYCRLIVPSPRREEVDETGNVGFLLKCLHKFFDPVLCY